MDSFVTRLRYYAKHPVELLHLYGMKKQYGQFVPSEDSLAIISERTDDREFCYEALKKVSRSFSIVIQQLPEELRDPVCLFYLVLRGLDTVEDDMQLDPQKKKEILLDFANRINGEPFTIENVGDTDDYRDLMAHFDKVVRQFKSLDSGYKDVITQVTEEMAYGMDQFGEMEIDSFKDWDKYCYYVAGLVGVGLSQLFIASGIEKDERLRSKELSVEMGLFLQKTNIIRDFAEDLEQDRVFWPQVAWNSEAEKLEELKSNTESGLVVLNRLIINALQHVPACLQYLKCLDDSMVFRFCGIPQLMAISTLERLYDNEKVLSSNVKIRKGKTARYFMSMDRYEQAYDEFLSVLKRISKLDSTGEVKTILKKIENSEYRV